MPHKCGLGLRHEDIFAPNVTESPLLNEQMRYIRLIDSTRMLKLTKAYGLRIRLLRPIGYFVPQGLPLLTVSRKDRFRSLRAVSNRPADSVCRSTARTSGAVISAMRRGPNAIEGPKSLSLADRRLRHSFRRFLLRTSRLMAAKDIGRLAFLRPTSEPLFLVWIELKASGTLFEFKPLKKILESNGGPGRGSGSLYDQWLMPRWNTETFHRFPMPFDASVPPTWKLNSVSLSGAKLNIMSPEFDARLCW